MKLADLHAALGTLVDAGWGECLVIDQSGNDITRVGEPGHHYSGGDPEVMLGAAVDFELRHSGSGT